MQRPVMQLEYMSAKSQFHDCPKSTLFICLMLVMVPIRLEITFSA